MERKNELLGIFVICLSVITSCQSDDLILSNDSTINVGEDKKAMLTFDSAKDFCDTYLAVSQLDYEGQKHWVDSVGIDNSLFYSIEECEDLSMHRAPRAFQMLFNRDMEMQINDTLIGYDSGIMYVKSIKGKEVSSPVEFGKIKVFQVEDENDEAETRAIVSGGWVKKGTGWFGQRYHEIFLAAGWKHRYVHEFRTIHMVAGPNNDVQQLFFDIKFQYRKNSGWKEATAETRDVNVSLSFWIENFSFDVPFKIRRSYTTTRNIEIPVAWAKWAAVDAFQWKWTVTCTGQINHMVVNNPSSKVVDIW